MAAGDGLLVRIRPPLGRLTRAQTLALCDAAMAWGNGEIDVTSRANLQIRGVTEAGWRGLVEALLAGGLIDPDSGARGARCDAGRARLAGWGRHAAYRHRVARAAVRPAGAAWQGWLCDRCRRCTGADPRARRFPGRARGGRQVGGARRGACGGGGRDARHRGRRADRAGAVVRRQRRCGGGADGAPCGGRAGGRDLGSRAHRATARSRGASAGRGGRARLRARSRQ
ncbi:hypothetical protein [Sphingomonas aerolata]|uniref:hypothetical protein n=1 Tax=Sphingomonas aerolata TaxID=185951 RepID=UPI002FE1A983